MYCADNVYRKKKIADDEKSIERAQHELTDLEKQTEVALADFSRVSNIL